MIFNVSTLIISTLGYLLFFVLLGKVRLLVAPFVWSCLVIMILYCFGLANALLLGAKLTLWGGVLLGIYTIWKAHSDILFNFQANKIIYVLFAAPFVIFYISTPDNFLFLVWDELSYWAKAQRLIYDSHALISKDSPISFKNYPPAQQLFQYYVTVSTNWSEKNVLFAQNILIFSAILAAVGGLITKPIWALLTYLTLFTAIYFFHADYVTIYSDSLLAVCFAACLALALKNQHTTHDQWILSICLCAFVLVKEVALIFFCMVMTVYLINLISDQHTSTVNKGFKKAVKVFWAIFLCALPVLVTIFSWRIHVSKIVTTKSGLAIPILEILSQNSFRQRFDTTITGLFLNMVKPAFFETAPIKFGFELSLIEIILWLGMISGLVITLLKRKQAIKVFLTLLVMFLGAFAYFVFLLWTYLFYFTEYEGIRLASFDRYVMTYILAWSILVISLLMKALSEKDSRGWILVPVSLLSIVIYFSPTKLIRDMKLIQVDRPILEKREKALDLANKIKNYIKPGEKVYFIAQNSNGYEKHMFDYSMIPYPASECWSVGERYNPGDVWTCQQNLKDLVKGYAYLAIYNADEQFWRDNGSLFEDGINQVTSGTFKINEENKSIKITPLQ